MCYHNKLRNNYYTCGHDVLVDEIIWVSSTTFPSHDKGYPLLILWFNNKNRPLFNC